MMFEHDDATRNVTTIEFKKMEAQIKLNGFFRNKEKSDEYFNRKNDLASIVPFAEQIRCQIDDAFCKRYNTCPPQKEPAQLLIEYFGFSEQQQIDLNLNSTKKSLLELFR
jgi:hypothetical protein